MLIDGEKWACDACVRGHRVSNCNHYGRNSCVCCHRTIVLTVLERPLTHINKKGRPVSQCPHCRGLRKARASHVKCECGSKKDTGKDKCCCGTGGRCSCALKKEHLDPVVEHGPRTLNRARSHTDSRKPRLAATQSDNTMTHFANGRHGPLHRNNHAASEHGVPYRIPRSRPHSIHGGHPLAQRSTDSLPLSRTPDYTSEYFPMLEERMVRSEHGSPGMMPTRGELLNDLPQLDMSYGSGMNTSLTASPIPEDFNSGSFPQFESYVSSADDQAPLSSALSAEPVDWNSMGLSLDNTFSQQFPQPPSYASFDQGPTSHPGLTTASSSGDVSEVEDVMSLHSPLPRQGSPYNFMDDASAMGAFNMSTESLHSMTPPPMFPTSAMNNLSMEPFTYGSASASPVPFDDYRSTTPLEQPTSYPQQFGMQDAPKMAFHAMADSRGPSPPAVRPTSDPRWASPYIGNESPAYNMPMQMKIEPVWSH
jgi:hypothetical protein